MPRYYFHLRDDIDTQDEEGRDFADDQSAMECAIEAARDMASANVRKGHLDLRHNIICAGEDGREVGIVSFADAVTISS